MPIPSRDEITLPILKLLQDKKTHKIKDVKNEIAKQFHVSKTEREETTLTNRKIFDTNTTWAVSLLRKAGLLENTSLGAFNITEEGLSVIKQPPQKIDDRYLTKFKKYKKWKRTFGHIEKTEGPTQSKKETLPKKYGIVAIIDVLGIKNVGVGNTSQKIQENWSELLNTTQESLRKEFKNNFKFSAFSDTMFITIEQDDVEQMLLTFSKAMWHTIPHSMENDMPIRGCFSLGEFYHKDTFFIGSAINEAAQYFQQSQWIGISASPSANSVLNELRKKDPITINNLYTKFDLPLKTSMEQDAYGINWPDQLFEMKSFDGLASMLKMIDDKLTKLTDFNAAIKWRTTRKFCSAALEDKQSMAN